MIVEFFSSEKLWNLGWGEEFVTNGKGFDVRFDVSF